MHVIKTSEKKENMTSTQVMFDLYYNRCDMYLIELTVKTILQS